MANEYRIKELKFPFNDGELNVFYPQIKRIVEITTGYLWWEKIIKEEKWEGFYKGENGVLLDEKPTGYNSFKVLYFPTLQEAQAIIDEFKKLIEDTIKQNIENKRKFYSRAGIDWDDDRFIKIHDIVIPD